MVHLDGTNRLGHVLKSKLLGFPLGFSCIDIAVSITHCIFKRIDCQN